MVVLRDFPPEAGLEIDDTPIASCFNQCTTLRGESKCDVTRSFSDSHEKDEDPVCDQIVYNF